MNVMVRNSERSLFKECQWKWQREYGDRLKPKQEESVALWFGTGIHLAMEHYFVPGLERGTPLVDTWNKYCDETDAGAKYVNTYDLFGNYEEALASRELGIDMLEGYLEHYGPEKHIEIISSEQTFQVPLAHKEWFRGLNGNAEFSDSVTTVVGTIDLVFRNRETGKLWMRDFKTAAQLTSAATQYLPLDDQAGLYSAMSERVLKEKGLIGESEKIQGIEYDYLLKRKRDTRPRNADGHYTNNPNKANYASALEGKTEVDFSKFTLAKLKDLAEELEITVLGDVSKQQPPVAFERKIVRRSSARKAIQIKRIMNDIEAMSLVRNNVLPATKTPSRTCGYCPFNEICQLDEDKKDWTSMAQALYNTWDPYSAHHTGEENVSVQS